MRLKRDDGAGDEKRWRDAGLEGLREQLSHLDAPRAIERQLRAHFRASRRADRPLPLLRLLLQQFLVPALAIGVVVAVSLPLLWRLVMDPDLSGEAVASSVAMTPFYALATGDVTSDTQQGVIVATELPRQVLFDFGLPVDPAQIGRPVRADMLLGASGEIIAVRFSNVQGELK